jgi:hypothetical protein
MIDHGDVSEKPGWVRISFHPTMTDSELDYILDSIDSVVTNRKQWSEDYHYDCKSGEYLHNTWEAPSEKDFETWFKL